MTLYEVSSLVITGSVLVAGIVTVIVYFKQLRTMQDALQQTLIMQRREIYLSMTTSLTENEVETMMLHLEDHFDLVTFNDRYAGNRSRIRSYLLMKRKYLYLVLTTAYRTNQDDPARLAPHIWLKELCSYQEFRDVHASQGKYYSDFSRLVDAEMPDVALRGWALYDFVA